MSRVLTGADSSTTPSAAPSHRSLWTFFVLVVALSVPFWLAGVVFEQQVLPSPPISSLMAVCPLLAASILVYRDHGTSGIHRLLRRAFDLQRIQAKIWFGPILLLMPGIMALSYLLMRFWQRPLPDPQFDLSAVPVLFIAFFLAGLGEEAGWTGYATDLLLGRLPALGAALGLGLVWAAWHFVPLAQPHRLPAWIGGWTIGTIGARILIVWLYRNTGQSVFAAILFHATINLSFALFPNEGSHYDPLITGLVTSMAATIVTVLWGPRTLSNSRLIRLFAPQQVQ